MARKPKNADIQAPQFVFIDNAQPINATQKRIIRKQAMRKVAENRKELGTYGKYNLGQLPLFTEPPENADQENEGPLDALIIPNSQSRIKYFLPPSMPVQGFEKAKITYNFDLFSLSALTSFHFGKATVKTLAADPGRLKHMLRMNREASYLGTKARVQLINSVTLFKLNVQSTSDTKHYLASFRFNSNKVAKLETPIRCTTR